MHRTTINFSRPDFSALASCLAIAGLLVSSLLTAPLLAQAPPVVRPAPGPAKAAPAPAQPGKPAAVKEEDKPAEPEDLSVETKDGVIIRFTYYAGKLKKKAVPIVMLHGWEGQRSDYRAMALYLQQLGHAVVTVDLRGHGQSLQYRLPNGDTKDIDRSLFRPRDLEAMVLDVEAIKKWLLDKNNEGELNIEALCLIAADFSTIIAMKWSAADWNAPILPAFKQGQDVKALVLLSPVQSFKGLTNRDAMAHPVVRGRLSTLVAAGSQTPKDLADAKRLFKTLEGHHIKPPTDPEERRKKLDLFMVTPETSLQGAALFGNGLETPRVVANFIELRLVSKMDEFSWSERRNPLSN